MRGNALTLSSRTPGVEIPVAEVDGVANLVKTSTLFAKHILREWQSKAMIGSESDKYLKDKIPVSHRVKMIQNQESRVDQWQSWECRAGWAFRQPGWQPSALFPHPTTPHVCLWTAEHSTQGTLYLYPHYLHLPPSSPPLVQCRLYYILIWPWASSQQGHKSTSHVSLGHPRIRVFLMNWRSTLKLFFSFHSLAKQLTAGEITEKYKHKSFVIYHSLLVQVKKVL